MPHILVVDDDGPTRAMLTDFLDDEGYQSSAAADGVTALALLTTLHPDLILVDVQMPAMDGHALCQAIQANPRTATIPVVLCSAHRDIAIPAACTYAAVVAKPFDLETLLTTITQALPSTHPEHRSSVPPG